jgi:integrase
MSESSNKYRPSSTATCNRVLALLKTIGKLANKLLDIPNVSENFSLLPEDNARTGNCNINETKRIIDASLLYENIYTGSFIALLFLLGCRKSELRERKWDNLDRVKKTITIQRTLGNPYIFIGRFKRCYINRPANQFNVIKKAARFDNPSEVLLHTARHSVASNLISNGVDISSVQKRLNHRSIESTVRYAR